MESATWLFFSPILVKRLEAAQLFEITALCWAHGHAKTVEQEVAGVEEAWVTAQRFAEGIARDDHLLVVGVVAHAQKPLAVQLATMVVGLVQIQREILAANPSARRCDSASSC